jgi:hypothetical protein
LNYHLGMRHYVTILLISLAGSPAIANEKKAFDPKAVFAPRSKPRRPSAPSPALLGRNLSQISDTPSTSALIIVESKNLASGSSGRPPQLAASFISSRASLIPRQLPPSPMMVLPVGIEQALDVPVQRPHDTDPRELKDPAAPRRGQVREKAAQDRRRAAG